MERVNEKAKLAIAQAENNANRLFDRLNDLRSEAEAVQCLYEHELKAIALLKLLLTDNRTWKLATE